jgi:hydrogenase maturation protease
MKSTLIVGIGNILLGDEGVGVRAIERMQSMDLGEDLELLDGGTSGADLVESLAGRDKVLVLDCVQFEASPGTVVRLRAEDLAGEDRPGLVDSLLMTRRLGCAPREVIVFGVVPASLACSLKLTPAVEAALPKLIQAVLEEAGTMHQAPGRKNRH